MKKIITVISSVLICCLSLQAAPVVFKAHNDCRVTGLETAGGKLYMSVTSGIYGGKSQVNIICSSNMGKSFSGPVLSLNDENLSVMGGVLWNDNAGRLWLFYTETAGYFDGRGVLKAIRCEDPSAAVPVWSEPKVLGYGVCTGKPVQVEGRMVLPFALWSRTLISAWPNLYGNLRKNEDKGLYTDIDDERGAGVYI